MKEYEYGERGMLPVFVISLEKSVRRAHCRSALGELGIDFRYIDAVEGERLSTTERERHYDAALNSQRYKRPLSPAEIGCYLSHRKAWEQVASGEAPAALVLEDDFQPAPGIASFLHALSAFDLSDVFVKIDGFESRRPLLLSETVVRVGGVSVGVPLGISALTTGYVIGRRAAKTMSAVRQRFYRPVDIDLKFLWEHKVPVYASSEILVRENADARKTSALAAGREQMQIGNPLLRAARHYRYQLDYRLNRLWWKNGASALKDVHEPWIQSAAE